mmetsp:Transcript_15540/g.19249  ORF Transcript_15540/g.19249 Transcript_15540/m.19249 type:complete len:102 (+) Transcript_15540:663-968(+)
MQFKVDIQIEVKKVEQIIFYTTFNQSYEINSSKYELDHLPAKHLPYSQQHSADIFQPCVCLYDVDNCERTGELHRKQKVGLSHSQRLLLLWKRKTWKSPAK